MTFVVILVLEVFQLLARPAITEQSAVGIEQDNSLLTVGLFSSLLNYELLARYQGVQTNLTVNTPVIAC